MVTTAQNRIGGFCLILSAALIMSTYLFTPGFALIDRVDTTDFIEMSRVLHEQPALSFFTVTLAVLGFILQLYGAFVLRRAVQGEGVGDTITRFGVMSLAVGTVIVVIERGLFYAVVHTLENGLGAGVGPDQSQLLNLIAVAVLAIENGISLMGFYAILLGLMGIGVGLLFRIQSNYYRGISLLMVLCCFVSLVFVTVISPFSGLVETFYWVFALAIILGNVWFTMLGVGLVKGMPEFSRDFSQN